MKLRNHIAIVLDQSGSMHGIRREVVKAFNAQVEAIKKGVADTGQETSVSLIVFANTARTIFFNADVTTLKPLTEASYTTGGMTAMFDGVASAIDQFRGLPDANHKETSFVVIVITDGYENASRTHQSTLVAALRETQQTDRWSFAFQVPKGTYKNDLIRAFGIPSDNVFEWEATVEGTQVAAVANTAGLSNFYEARTRGVTSVKNFYEVTTDLSAVASKTIHSKLDDISNNFTVYDVRQEARIDEFIEAKTKKPYVVGSGYYQLMKTEKIQQGKNVLIMEKGKKAIWGGKAARDLIGLPDDGEAKVEPGNHSNYDVFVQSKAPNRKLPRGTKVIFDKTKKKGETPTWDYEAAAAAKAAKSTT